MAIRRPTQITQRYDVPECVEFSQPRMGVISAIIGFTILVGGPLYVALFMDEHEFLHAKMRRGGRIVKAIEQSVGWDNFAILTLAFALFTTVVFVVVLWKITDNTPDITAYHDRLYFHPAVRFNSANYDDISRWNVERSGGKSVLCIEFHESYWSLQGLYKRKNLKIESGSDELKPLTEFFSHHQEMRQKFGS